MGLSDKLVEQYKSPRGFVGKIIPFSGNFFDIVTAFQTHYFWPDLKNDFKEVHRVLKSEGQFLVVFRESIVKYHMAKYKTVSAMRELFLKTGFSDVDISRSRGYACWVVTK